MKERSILFKGEMVRAILAGTKTQTRRVVKPQPELIYRIEGDTIAVVHNQGALHGFNFPASNGKTDGCGARSLDVGFQNEAVQSKERGALSWNVPGCNVCVAPFFSGMNLWVRETWYCDDFRVQRGPYLKPDDMDLVEARQDGTLVYAADGLRPYEAEQPIWRPSIHMPRWASRITLEVTGVRVERLQDISEADAKAEGVTADCPVGYIPAHAKAPHTYCYAQLWESINGAGSWNTNPFVWVVSFKRV